MDSLQVALKLGEYRYFMASMKRCKIFHEKVHSDFAEDNTLNFV